MKKRDLIEYFSTCGEHYLLSDDFVKKYQQNKGKTPNTDTGYIKNAYNKGMNIDADRAEPNQKWHLLNSYFEIDKKEFNINKEIYDKSALIWSMGNVDTGKGGPGLKCPELLLWIAEAVGCDICEAKAEAEKYCAKGERLLACNAIKKIIKWEEIENKISNYIQHD